MNWAEENNFDGYEPDYDPDELGEDNWLSRDGTIIKIYEMTNQHLYNAYKLTNDERLQREMMLRLFRRNFGEVV